MAIRPRSTPTQRDTALERITSTQTIITTVSARVEIALEVQRRVGRRWPSARSCRGR